MITKKLDIKQPYKQIKACISEEEAKKARYIASIKGMTLQGWFGQIIREQIAKEVSDDRS